MLYGIKGITATGQLVYGCSHVHSQPIQAITGGDGSDPVVISFEPTTGPAVVLGAVAVSRRTLVLWCRDCFAAFPEAFRSVRLKAACAALCPVVTEGLGKIEEVT